MDITLGTYATVLGLTTWRVVKVTGIGKLIAGSKNVTDLVPFGVGNVVGVTGGLCTGGILGGLGWLSYQASVYGGQLTLWGATGADSTTQYHGVEPIPLSNGGSLLLFVVAVGGAAAWKGLNKGPKRQLMAGVVNGAALTAVPLVAYYSHLALSTGGDSLLTALNHAVSS
ncbi:hypothetical protein P3T27_007537 [Kitasatospora sp. MAA19]|uniref:hypothetical protein n=1 Tax=unclassified Kitasatospora TaxID=2633591 RepID=UPI002476A9D2|nr:hypothetical protein [Kitasatospora sp. MAA19]MDH6710786.1 hypothetical protein [Kitasatospora sp. MAA19]